MSARELQFFRIIRLLTENFQGVGANQSSVNERSHGKGEIIAAERNMVVLGPIVDFAIIVDDEGVGVESDWLFESTLFKLLAALRENGGNIGLSLFADVKKTTHVFSTKRI